MEYFFVILAWVLGPWFTFLTFLKIHAQHEYDKSPLEQHLDAMKGVRKTYPLRYNPHTAVVSWAYIVFYYFN